VGGLSSPVTLRQMVSARNTVRISNGHLDNDVRMKASDARSYNGWRVECA
jgi:hypothetical protein